MPTEMAMDRLPTGPAYPHGLGQGPSRCNGVPDITINAQGDATPKLKQPRTDNPEMNKYGGASEGKHCLLHGELRRPRQTLVSALCEKASPPAPAMVRPSCLGPSAESTISGGKSWPVA